MKKVIGIIGVVAFAMTIFFSANNVNNLNSDVSLASITTTQEANAECVASLFPEYNTGVCTYSGRFCVRGTSFYLAKCDPELSTW